MAYCVKCGAKVDDGTMSCPQCGAPIPELAGGRSDSRTAGSTADYSQSGGQEYTYGQGYTYNQSNGSGTAGYAQEPYGSYGYGSYGYGSQAYFDRSEVSRNKAMGVLSYIGILVLIPLIVPSPADLPSCIRTIAVSAIQSIANMIIKIIFKISTFYTSCN